MANQSGRIGFFSQGFAVLTAAFCAACTASGEGQLVNVPTTPASDERLTLTIWEADSALERGELSGDFTLHTRIEGDQLVATIEASAAVDLRALYFDVQYEAARLHPLSARSTGLLDPSGALLELAYLAEPGRVYHGQVLSRPQERHGFYGTAVLAELRFGAGPASSVRSASLAPTSPLSATILSVVDDKLTWGYYNQGDYNQDSLVTINDLTPLGQNFGESVAPAAFPADSEEAVVDGDGNGEINITDITPIGANFGRQVESYNIYAQPTGIAYPASPAAPSTVSPTATVMYSAHLPQAGQGRLRYEFSLLPEQLGLFSWVRPAEGTSEGTPSNMLQVPAGNETPVASLEANPGSGFAPLEVAFDASASSDEDGSIVKYEWDFDGDGDFDLDTGAVPVAQHTYDQPGTFNATVRVTDDGNETATALRVISVSEPQGEGPVAVIMVSAQLGDAPFLVLFDASTSVPGEFGIETYEWDFDGDGTFDETTAAPTADFTYDTPGTYFPLLRITDEINLTDEQDTVIVVGDGGTNPPADSILAIPLDPTVASGSPAVFTIYTYRAANPFQYLNGARLVMPTTVTYVADSLNVGIPGGTNAAIDGIWTQVNPEFGMLLPLESFIIPEDLGGGLHCYDISVTPLGGTDISPATGAIFNIALATPADLSLTFEVENEVKRTYYSDSTTDEFMWANATNAGMPGVDVE